MKGEMFVSVAVVIDRPIPSLMDDISLIERELRERYSDYEILLVAQRRLHGTLFEMQVDKILANVPCVRFIQLAFDVDPDLARAAAVENTIGDFVVIYDLTVDTLPIIAEAVDLCRLGSDIVIGVSPHKQSLISRTISNLAGCILNTIGYQIPVDATNFRCMSRRAVNTVISTGRFYHQFNLRLQKTGYKSKIISYYPNIIPTKSLSVVELLLHVLHILIFNSSLPLRWMSCIGIFGSLVGLGFSAFSIMIHFLRSGVVEGWTTTIVFISLQFMLIFFILAFISEYMRRLIDEHRGNDDYSIVYEKNSSNMIDGDRINVHENSMITEKNMVQTARNS